MSFNDLDTLTLDKLRKLPEYKVLPSTLKKSKLNVDDLRNQIYSYRRHTARFTCQSYYNYTPDEIMSTVKQVLYDYYKHGSRSSKKVDIIHFFIRCLIIQIIREKAPDIIIDINVLSQPYKEARVQGILYDKDVDITVRYKKHNVGLVSVKFITSNYNQNANNYFESLLGECINLKSVPARPRVFWFSLFTFENIPYYNKKHELVSYEKIKVDKYKILWNESFRHTILPDCISLTIIDNNKLMRNPDTLNEEEKIQENLTQFIQELLPGTYKEYSPLKFYPQLIQFCEKVIALIRQEYMLRPIQGNRIIGIKSNNL
jgi:hypothetical protein